MGIVLRSTLIVGVALGLNVPHAKAGPCSREIARIEEVMRDPGPDIGPTNPQSVGAQLHRQPTPSSVARAEERADARYIEAMAKTRALDAEGDPRCISVMTEIKDLTGME